MESLDHTPISSSNNATHYRNPVPTVDIIIELWDRPESPIVLIERLNSPFGWAIPGGFVDYGETIEQAAQREAMEETQLEIDLLQQFHVYSDPTRDPRLHTISIVFLAKAKGEPKAGDDAKAIGIFLPDHLPVNLCFDHGKILADYYQYRYGHFRVKPLQTEPHWHSVS